MASQPLLDKNAYYDTGLDYPYISPNTFAFVLNYKRTSLRLRRSSRSTRARRMARRPTSKDSTRARAARIRVGRHSRCGESADRRLHVVRRGRNRRQRHVARTSLRSKSVHGHVRHVRAIPAALAIQHGTADELRFQPARNGEPHRREPGQPMLRRIGRAVDRGIRRATPTAVMRTTSSSLATSTTGQARTTSPQTACRSTRTSRCRSCRRTATSTHATCRCRCRSTSNCKSNCRCAR